MTDIPEKSLVFSFSDMHDAIKYDKWSFYCKRFQGLQNTKAIDILCITNDTVWLIEVKDFRSKNRELNCCIVDNLVRKVRDTLAGLAAASANGTSEEQNIARKALSKHQWRVVFHIEQIDNLEINSSSLQIQLRKRLEAIDDKFLITNTELASKMTPWIVTEQTRYSNS